MRRWTIVLLAAVTVLVGVLAGAPAAQAHARLVSSDPPSGARLEAAPAELVLRFDEPVELSLGAVRLYDDTGREYPVGEARHPDGDATVVAVPLPDPGRGLFVATWRVTSGDGHPVRGALTFRVGEGGTSASAALVDRLLARQGGDPAVGAAHALARFGSFLGVLVLLGGVGFLTAAWPAGASAAATRRLLGAAWAVGLVGTVAGLALLGPYLAGGGFADAFDPDQWRSVLTTRVGRAWGLRIVGLGLAALVLWRLVAVTARTAWTVLAGAVGVGLLATFVVGGHAASGTRVALGVVAGAVHLAAAATWLGGLVVLGVVALRHARTPDLAGAVARFSTVAAVAVGVIAVSGSAQSWRQVGSLDALGATTYGRLLMVKVALVAVMVAVAAASRRQVRGRRSAPVPVGAAGPPGASPTRRTLRRTVLVEAAVGVAVLAVTALVVNTPPARSETARPFATVLVQGDRLLDVSLSPATRGANELHLVLSSTSGALQRAEGATVRLTLPERDLGPLPVRVDSAGPDHWVATGLDIPYAGTWRLEVLVSVGGAQVRFAVDVPVR